MKNLQLLLLSIALILCAETKIIAQGELWGVASAGGASNLGVIYKINDDGSNYSVQYEFTPATMGHTSAFRHTRAANGKFYGITPNGGANQIGVLYEFDPVTHILIHKVDFTGVGTGSEPMSNLLQASNGKMYGMALNGGASNLGTLFDYDAATNVFTKRFDFNGIDGENPMGSLMEASNGKLYGMTTGGGLNDSGVLFEFNPSTNTFTKLVDLTSPRGFPQGALVQASNGKLYGVLPNGGLLGRGMIFEYDPSSNVYNKKFDFLSFGGEYPYGDLLQVSNGKLYGLTVQGGINNSGVLFEYNPGTGSCSKKFEFSGPDGRAPYASLTLGSNGNLYGTTFEGGTQNLGVLFEFNLITNTYTKKMDFVAGTGANPVGGLTPCNAILVNPASQNVCAFSNLTFRVLATGISLTYLWQEDAGSGFVDLTDGGIYSGVTTGSLVITGVPGTMNNYQYRCVVSGTCASSATSNSASINIISPPSISSQPVNLNPNLGGIAVFIVLANGNNLSYQWKRGLVDVGTNSPTLALFNVSAVDEGTYTVTVTGDCGSTTSTPANLTIIYPLAISSFSPHFGSIGSTVNIIGTGFSPTAVDNIVFFGATQAVVTSATSTLLTVTVPGGATYQPISVSKNGLTTYSSQAFDVTFSGQSILDYAPNVSSLDFKTDLVPFSEAIGDLDGDGKPELAVANLLSNTITIFKNDSPYGSVTRPSFVSKITLHTAQSPVSVKISDLNADGKADLVVTNYESASVSVFNNINSVSGTISFDDSHRIDFSTGDHPRGIAIGDIDGDGRPDLVVANAVSSTLSVFKNTNASGPITASSFSPAVTLNTGTGAFYVSMGDLDLDGKLDLVVTNYDANTISLFRNFSVPGTILNSSFSKYTVDTGSNPTDVTITDLDGDNKPDLVVTNYFNGAGGNSISLYRNIIGSPGPFSAGSFDGRINLDTGINPALIAIGDVDGNGKQDIVVGNNGSNSVSIFRNTGVFVLAPKIDFSTGRGPYALAVGDLDGDGSPEITSANQYNNSISILIPLPIISSFNPPSGPIGTTVTITGSNFSTTPADNIVFFGATRAAVNTATSSQLTVTVPSGATYQPISVTTNGFTTFSSKPFDVTFPGVLDASSFAVDPNFSTGIAPGPTAVGDLDGDGRPDLVVANILGNSISVFRNINQNAPIGLASFDNKVDIPVGVYPYGLAIGDLNGDGRPEIVVTNYGDNTAMIFKNASISGQINTNSFDPPVTFNTGFGPRGVAIGDLNKDGRPDIALVNSSNTNSNSVFVLTNTGNGTIAFTLQSFAAGSTQFPAAYDVAISDIDGDGKLDLAVACGLSTGVSILRNNTNGIASQVSFDSQILVGGNGGYSSISAGDLDGDNKPDLVVAGGQGGFVIKNNSISSPSSISMAAPFSLSLSPSDVAIGDLDGDSKPDLTFTSQVGISVFKNTCSTGIIDVGSFITKFNFTAGLSPFGIAIGDLNGDSNPEIITTNLSGNNISILRGRPNISSFIPSSGPVGATVTINGSNFGRTISNNVVYFGATKATVSNVDAFGTQLTVTVPTGATHQPISVLSYGLTGYSGQPFDITFTGPGILDMAPHVRKTDFATGVGPHDIAIKDLNGDGKPDLAVPNFDDNSVTLFRNTGSSFVTAITLNTNTNPVSVAIGDLNGDGKPDVVVTNQGSNKLNVIQNNDILVSGFFNAARYDFATGTNPLGVAIGDLDGDGMPDLVVANNGAASVWVYRNVGKPSDNLSPGSFAAGVPFATGSGPVNVAISDLDLDGKPDIVVVNSGDHTVSLLRNTSIPGLINAGSFEPKTDLPAGAFSTPTAIAIANLDGDSKPDLVVTNVGDNQISVFRNKTNGPGSFSLGSFQSRVVLNVEGSPRSAAIDDMDGDGKLDLIIANNGSNSISIFKNNTGSGDFIQSSFLSIPTLTTGQNPWGIAVGDLDADGKPEMATSNLGGNSISLIYNTRQAITFNSLTSKIFGDPNFNLTATASSGLTVSYVSGDPSVASVTGNIVTIIGAGTTVITASQPGNANFLPATDVVQTLTVNKADQVITFGPLSAKQIVDPPFILTATTSSNLHPVYVSDNLRVASISVRTVTIGIAGFANITASQPGDSNYNPAPDVIQILTVEEPTPTVPAAAITFSNVFSTQMRISYVHGNGRNDLVVMRQGAAVNWAPTNGQDYIPNTDFSMATDQGSGNKVVAALGQIVDVKGLTPNTLYFVKVYEYNGHGVQTKFLIPGAPSNSVTTLPLPNVYVTNPANNVVNRPLTLNVTAKVLAGSSTYTIELNDAFDFTGNSFVMSGARTQNFTGLAYATLYYTRVKTDLSPDYGQATTFTTVVPSIQVTAPANGAVSQSITPNVTATNLAGASVWTIELNDAADFTGNSFVKFGARTQSFTGLSYNTTYYTRVFTDVYAPYGPITSFTTIAPNIFVSTPANNASNQNVTLNVTATNLATASAWTIELNTASNFSGTAIVQTGPRTQSFAGLAYNTTYYNRVKTDIYPFYGQSNSFDTAPAEFFAYTTAPANGATNVNLTVNVTSNTVIGAGNYTIEINPNPGFSPGTAIVQSGPGRTYSFSGLQVSTTYHTRVMTDLSPSWGQTRSFATASALSLSYVTNPTNNAVNRLWHLNVTANLIPQANSYTIELNTDPNFLSAGITLNSASNVINFAGLAFNTVYYNRVKTDLDPGWGVTRQFTTDHPVNYSYMNAPADGATNVAYITNITANSVLDATTYTIEANTLPGFNGTSIVKIGARTQAFSLAYDQVYYVRVYTNLDPGGWGVTRSFTTGNPVSFAYVTSPADGAVGVPSTVNVTSNMVPGAATYTIELNTSSLFDGTSFVLTGAGRTKNFTGLADGKTYYERVSTDLSGGAWGATRSFTTFDPLARMATNWVSEDKLEEKTDEVVIEPFDLLVFNNPFKTKLSLIIRTFQSRDATVSLQDLTGKIIYKSQERTNTIIDIEREMAPAIYLLKVETGNESKIVRVVKVD